MLLSQEHAFNARWPENIPEAVGEGLGGSFLKQKRPTLLMVLELEAEAGDG